MNREERDQLRDKHKPVQWNHGFVSCDVCTEIIEENDYPVLYPCDVIKVLDEFDLVYRELEVSKKGINVLLDAGLAATGAFKELAAQPCSQCGEKL